MAKKTRKSKFEMSVVENVIRERTIRKRTQTYIAMLLDVTDGYVGQIKSPNSASRYTLDQLNIIVLDFGCSPKDFMPDEGVKED